MLGCPRGWFFRVALTSALILRPEQRARLLAARPAPRARSQAPGKCAASPLPPGLLGQPSARRPCPKPRLEGQHGLGRRPGRVLSTPRAHGASITDRARGSATGARLVLRLGGAGPAPPLSGRVLAAAAPSLLSSQRRCRRVDPCPTPPLCPRGFLNSSSSRKRQSAFILKPFTALPCTAGPAHVLSSSYLSLITNSDLCAGQALR